MPRTASIAYRSQKGRDAEVELAHLLQADGWLVASRRHIGGAGDLLAVKSAPSQTFEGLNLSKVWLIEVKARTNVWQGFRRKDRLALIETAREFNAQPWLASKPPGQIEWTWLSPADWPAS
jgi:Holliday junction resolvase